MGLGQAECSSVINTHCYYAFINDTPYTMQLVEDESWYGDLYSHGFDPPPVETPLPGQKEVFGFVEDEWGSASWIQAAI